MRARAVVGARRESAARRRGFSLVELLVVLFVIVMMTSLATLNVGDGGQQQLLESQVRELRNVAEFALEEAQMAGRDMGLVLAVDPRGAETRYLYDWRERRPEGWRSPALARDVLAPRTLVADVELVLLLDGVPASDLLTAPLAEDAAPQVVFYASGEVAPGALEWRSRETAELLWRLEWDLLGRMAMMPRGLADDADALR
ncbi:MAG: type II secretion system protein GspH [Haliea sp.]|uniref:GspH/FimT family pseudopilin n=1 Tax=Haliea sp. TaxID=1932666 RepID=UPI000C444C7D|nr:GspH/FimT family pseudopilin [Haliea sp.]MBM69279.1 type II secretion system protein GspH [Haliea sp.]|tara:strand:+ start:31600 stop:32202 length:603 start_codon:yes stop_codon:yes gene_type:complete